MVSLICRVPARWAEPVGQQWPLVRTLLAAKAPMGRQVLHNDVSDLAPGTYLVELRMQDVRSTAFRTLTAQSSTTFSPRLGRRASRTTFRCCSSHSSVAVPARTGCSPSDDSRRSVAVRRTHPGAGGSARPWSVRQVRRNPSGSEARPSGQEVTEQTHLDRGGHLLVEHAVGGLA